MVKAVDPQPRENLLKSKAGSPMQFMHEYLLHDSERDSLVRFRGPFIMPNWLGVEDHEDDYVVEDSWITLYHIANEQYNDPELMWVIAARNSLDLPDVQIYKGKRLKIPHKDWVEDHLLPQGRTIRSQK